MAGHGQQLAKLRTHNEPEQDLCFLIDGEFVNKGGRWGAMDALGAEWQQLLDEMNATLVA